LLVFAPSVSVAAQAPSRISIQWDGPASCPRSTLDASLAERIDAEAAQAQGLEVNIRVTERADAFNLVLEIEGERASSERNVELPTCEDVRRAAAVLIATAITRDLHELPTETEERPAHVAAWWLRGGALLDLRSLPQASGGPMLGVAIAPLERVQTWLDLRYLVARQTEPGAESLRAQIDLFGAAGGASYVWMRGSLSFGPALEAELGVLRGKVSGKRAADSRVAPWLSAWGGGRLGYALDRVTVDFSLLAGTPLVRSSFVWGADADPYQTRALGVRVFLGLSMALGPKKSAAPGQE
jgi:hypothetical protein